MFIIVCGAGKVGSNLARTLADKNHDVVVIERSAEKSQKLASNPRLLVVNGDACNVEFLEQAEAHRADVVVAVTGDDDDNLVICQLAKEIYKVPRVIARVNNPKSESIFLALGIEGISATTIIAKLIEEESTIGDVIMLSSLRRGKVILVEVDLPDEPCFACDRPLKQLRLPDDSILVAIVRGDQVLIPRGNTILQPGDGVIAISEIGKEDKLRAILLGKPATRRPRN